MHPDIIDMLNAGFFFEPGCTNFCSTSTHPSTHHSVFILQHNSLLWLHLFVFGFAFNFCTFPCSVVGKLLFMKASTCPRLFRRLPLANLVASAETFTGLVWIFRGSCGYYRSAVTPDWWKWMKNALWRQTGSARLSAPRRIITTTSILQTVTLARRVTIDRPIIRLR